MLYACALPNRGPRLFACSMQKLLLVLDTMRGQARCHSTGTLERSSQETGVALPLARETCGSVLQHTIVCQNRQDVGSPLDAR